MNPSVLVRWFFTAHECADITGAFKEMSGCGQSEKQPTHKEFGKIRKKRDEEDVQKVTKLLLTVAKNPYEVAERLNEETDIEGQEIPTSGHGNHDAGQENSETGQEDETVDQSESEEEQDREPTKFEYPLTNIITGMVVPEEVTQHILKSSFIGRKEMLNFVKDRLIDKKIGFFDTLSKQKLKTFASIRKPISITVKSKEKSITVDRDLFARLVIIVKSREVDIRNLFQYELTTVPLSLSKLDGSLNKSPKSLLLAEFEKNAEVLPDLPRDEASSTWIVDGMALIQMVRGGKAKTFGELAQVLFQIILSIFQRPKEKMSLLIDMTRKIP